MDFRLNLKFVLYLQSQYLNENLGFLNPKLLQVAKTNPLNIKIRYDKIIKSIISITYIRL